MIEGGFKILLGLAIFAAFVASAWIGYAHEVGALQ